MTQPLKRLGFTLFLLCAVGLLGALVLVVAKDRELPSVTPGEPQTAQAGFATITARQSSVNGKKANEASLAESSAKSSNRNRESETELVQLLIEKIDSLPDADPATKAKLRGVLLAVAADLAPEKSSVHDGHPTTADPAQSEPKRPSSDKSTSTGQGSKDEAVKAVKSAEESRSDSQESPPTAVVKALIEMMDQADKTLRKYLGDAAKTRIQQANKKPSPPRVFNPKRKPASSASSDESPAE